MKLLLAFMALIVLANAQTSSLFDDFQTFSSVDANEDEPTETSVVDAAGILGGRRSLTVTRTEGSNNALEASCTIVGGFFALSTDVSVIGDCVASYDGPAGAGFGPVDYNAFGCDCWNLRIIESDNNVGFAITADSASRGPQTSSFMLAVDINNPIDVCIPFTDDRAAYSDVVGVDFQIEGRVANVDVNLQSVCCQPAVTCVHTIDALNGADIDNLFVGDTIKLSIECTNYESMPADLQEITVAFPFDDNFGIMDAGSIMCDGDVAPDTQGVMDNTLDFTASLVDTEGIRCMVNVDLVGSGSVDDIAARIFTSSGDSNFPFQSNFNVDRQGSLEFCELPVPASLVIVDPPTTLPPTTEPPTTEPPTTLPPTTLPPTTLPPTTLPPTTLPPTTLPPTTLPPTTLPPTTLPPTTLPPTTLPPTTEPPTAPRTVCVAPRIIDGMCDCQTFPCFEADDGSNSFRCETDEWYCWFVITVPPSGRFRVSYRGQMCYCTL